MLIPSVSLNQHIPSWNSYFDRSLLSSLLSTVKSVPLKSPLDIIHFESSWTMISSLVVPVLPSAGLVTPVKWTSPTSDAAKTWLFPILMTPIIIAIIKIPHFMFRIKLSFFLNLISLCILFFLSLLLRNLSLDIFKNLHSAIAL